MKTTNVLFRSLSGIILVNIIQTTTCFASITSSRPNIIIILADDAGYADFGFMGSKDIKTPNLDELASHGRFFTDAHVAATVSSPSRAMLLTGRYGQRFGYECNISIEGDGLPADEEILPALLKRHGYRTACIGKWHLGSLQEQHPNNKGFDTFYGLIGGSRPYFYNINTCDKDGAKTQYQYNGKALSFDDYFTDELTNRAKQVISESEQPLMMYLSYTAPHSPNQALKEDLDRFNGQQRQMYAAMMYALDRGIGEVVQELKQSGKYDNTLVFFLSDNGGAITNNSSNLPLKGFKGNKFEGGHRVPFLVSWGDRFKQREPFRGLTSSLDIFATILDILQIEENQLNKPIDGVSLLPYLTGDKIGDPHDILFWRKMDTRAVRCGDYKLIITRGVDSVMYNLKEGIDERNNIFNKKQDKAKELMEQLAKWEKDYCTPPSWGEDGWRTITNDYHKRLMKDEIMSSEDLRK